MEFQFPKTMSEWVPLLVPLLTFLVGFAYFALPDVVLKRLGLKAVATKPAAIGAGRSTFAGFLMGSGLTAILLQQPIAFQIIGFGWLIAALGRVFSNLLDGTHNAMNWVRAAISFAFFIAVYSQFGFPSFSGWAWPDQRGEWLVFLTAALTLGCGLLFFIESGLGLRLLRLEPIKQREEAFGELRGIVGGFYLAVALAVLFSGNFLAPLVLGACWLMTAFGRLISMMSDRANTFFNVLLFLFELALAGVCIFVTFGYIN